MGSLIFYKDYLIGAVVGFLTGILAFFIFSFLDIDFRFKRTLFLLGIPVLWVCGIWLGGFLGKWLPFFNQFGKFAAVGFLSTTIDFSILNIVSLATGITTGIVVGWINTPGFLVATLNGYLWNKLWVFSDKDRSAINGKKENNIFGDFPKFLAVTTTGLFINSSLIVILTTFLNFGISSHIWLNISKVVATAIALIWNFIGYKFIAFRKYV